MTRTFLATFALVFAAILGLYGFDMFLAKAEQAESHAEAQRLFDEGQALLRNGDTSNAIERFRGALEFSRNNAEYQLALARALLRAGKLTDSEDVAKGLLDRNPTDARPNLTMARVLTKQGRIGDAEAYYHRAIYGQWPGAGAAGQRLPVRLELIELLARQDDKQALLSELLTLQSEKLDLPTRERIAQLYDVAGSPARATEMFREILREQPSNPKAFAGLGTAEFARGNYRAAHLDFLVASRLKPDDNEIRKQLALSSEVLTLDPMQRGLRESQRHERAARVLTLAELSLSRCTETAGGQSASEAKPLLDAADAALQQRAQPAVDDDATDANLDLAEKLWQERRKQCRQPIPEAEQALALVLTKIAQ